MVLRCIDANIHAWSVNPPIEEDPDVFHESAKFQMEADIMREHDEAGNNSSIRV
jgi:hypothetical protein